MAESSGISPRQIVELTASADRDRFAIYVYTQQQWGMEQAEKYNGFSEATLQQLAERPEIAPFVEGRKNTRVFVARWKNTYQGHRIFYNEIEGGILVLRILHTSMNWQEYLAE